MSYIPLFQALSIVGASAIATILTVVDQAIVLQIVAVITDAFVVKPLRTFRPN
jgi:uncharacterized membrane protein